MIISYEMFRNLTNENDFLINKEERGVFTASLIDPGPQLVVCDEGHLLKNSKTMQFNAIKKIATERKVILTGTPIQNNLREYHTMVQLVKPNLLGTEKEFTENFINPIMNGQHANSTESDVRVMKSRSHILHKMLAGKLNFSSFSNMNLNLLF